MHLWASSFVLQWLNQKTLEEKFMHKKLLGSMVITFLAFSILAAAGQKDSAKNKLVGKWAGTWTGESSGKFEMTISKDAAGKLSATITATPDQGEPNTMVSTSMEQTAEKIKIKCDGQGSEVEVVLEGAFEGQSLKGSYSVRNKGQGDQVESGSWSASKKAPRT
jgi:hypothetical protein